MSENDQRCQVVRRLTSSEIEQQLRMAASSFIEETKRGQLEQGNELLSADESDALLEALEAGTRDRVLGDETFRRMVYESWLDLSQERDNFDPDKLEELFVQLKSELQCVCCDVASDFEQLQFDLPRAKEVIGLIEKQLADNQCGKALRVLRENRGLLPQSDFYRYSEIAWSRISRLDERFRQVWLRYQARSGVTQVAFHLDRPARQANNEGIENELKEKDFVATTREVLKRIQEGKQDLISDEETAKLWSALDSVQGFKHFDSMDFREYLLIAWRDLTESTTPAEIEQAVRLWGTFDDSQKRVANDFLEDFEVLLFPADVGQQVDALLAVEDYIGALEAVRRFCCDGKSSSQLRAKIWEAASIAFDDLRLRDIAESFSAVAGKQLTI